MPQPIPNVLPPAKAEMEHQYDRKEMTQMLLQKLEGLRTEKPEWFTYSDTLGERPIDGLMREMQRRSDAETEHLSRQSSLKFDQKRQIQQNMRVAPEYTQEVQNQAPAQPGAFKPMGKVM